MDGLTHPEVMKLASLGNQGVQASHCSRDLVRSLGPAFEDLAAVSYLSVPVQGHREVQPQDIQMEVQFPHGDPEFLEPQRPVRPCLCTSSSTLEGGLPLQVCTPQATQLRDVQTRLGGPGWESQSFGDSIAIASSIERLCQAAHVARPVIAQRISFSFRSFCCLTGRPLECANGRGRFGGQTAGGHPKASPRPRQTLYSAGHWEISKVLAGVAFVEMQSQDPQSAFQGLCRGHPRWSAAVCDPNPPRPFARCRAGQRNKQGLMHDPFTAWLTRNAQTCYQLADLPPSNPHPNFQKVNSELDLRLNLDGVWLEFPYSGSVSRCAANAEFRIEFRIVIASR